MSGIVSSLVKKSLEHESHDLRDSIAKADKGKSEVTPNLDKPLGKEVSSAPDVKVDSLKSELDKPVSLEAPATIAATLEPTQRYGAAIKEHLVAYSGKDNETGQVLKRSLKGISKYKVNPEYAEQNLKQQAGFSAEVKDAARSNAERIINSKKTHVTRTDDMVKKVSKKFGEIGGTNDPLYDQAELSAKGKVIDASQMKFVGKTPVEALDKLMGKRAQKYLDKGVKIRVPSDYYDGIKKDIGHRIEELLTQEKTARNLGKTDAVKNLQEKIKRLKTLNKNLEKSNVSNAEAMEARLSPKISTAKDVLDVGHRGGVESAKFGAVISGGISTIRNVVKVIEGEKDLSDAAIDIVYDTGTGAATSYFVGFAGSTLGGVLRNSTSSMMRSISKSGLPATIAVAALETGKTLYKYFDGEVDGMQCVEELGEKTTGVVGSGLAATAGQILIPIPVVGALVGSMVGYSLSTFCYNSLVDLVKGGDPIQDTRPQIECKEAIQNYQVKMDAIADKIPELRDGINAFKENLSKEIIC